MDLKKIVIISGKSGLFKVLGQNRSVYIVESLLDGTKKPVSLINRITSIEEIVVFTMTEEIKLMEIFKRMKKITNAQPAVSHKSPDNEIIEFFESVVPDYNKQKVYVSDMKKIIMWYNLLQQNNMLDVLEEEKTEAETEKQTEEKPKEEKEPDSEKKETTEKKEDKSLKE